MILGAAIIFAGPALDVLFGKEDDSLEGYEPIPAPPPPPGWTEEWPPDGQ